MDCGLGVWRTMEVWSGFGITTTCYIKQKKKKMFFDTCGVL